VRSSYLTKAGVGVRGEEVELPRSGWGEVRASLNHHNFPERGDWELSVGWLVCLSCFFVNAREAPQGVGHGALLILNQLLLAVVHYGDQLGSHQMHSLYLGQLDFAPFAFACRRQGWRCISLSCIIMRGEFGWIESSLIQGSSLTQSARDASLNLCAVLALPLHPAYRAPAAASTSPLWTQICASALAAEMLLENDGDRGQYGQGRRRLAAAAWRQRIRGQRDPSSESP